MEQYQTETSKIEKKIQNAETNELRFWNKWNGVASGALANLTDDVYMYEIENHKYGKGYGIKYGNKNFWFSPGYGSQKGILVNAVNESITSEEIESVDPVMEEQIQRLIGLGLDKINNKNIK